MAATTMSISPGLSLGPLYLGASLQEVLTIIKEERAQYPKIDLHYNRSDPLTTPVVVSLPQNGLRLRFDAADQRLRLIEVMDFKKIKLTYKGSELMRAHETSSGPAFKRIYQIIGASYPGEYHPPKQGVTGTYCLSWAGIAFTFPLQHTDYAPQKDHVSMLSSSAASSATHMAIFEGNSWPEVRQDLFIRIPHGPRLSALTTRPKDNLPAEIEFASVQGDGHLQFIRRHPVPSFSILLNQTTPQDLITELGPPDATHKREPDPLPTTQLPSHRRKSSATRPTPNGRTNVPSQPSSYSSTGTDTFDADFDSGEADDDSSDRTGRETFWSYFSHGMDILISPPTPPAQPARPGETPLSASPHLVVTKVVLHANVPGSYAFNRHRRLRWTLNLLEAEYVDDLTSETKFDDLKPTLMHIFQQQQQQQNRQSGVGGDSVSATALAEMGKGKVVNRTWGGSPSDSSFFLPDAGEDLVEGGGSEQWLGNTRVFTFPGLVFEVLENGVVGALTVY